MLPQVYMSPGAAWQPSPSPHTTPQHSTPHIAPHTTAHTTHTTAQHSTPYHTIPHHMTQHYHNSLHNNYCNKVTTVCIEESFASALLQLAHGYIVGWRRGQLMECSPHQHYQQHTSRLTPHTTVIFTLKKWIKFTSSHSVISGLNSMVDSSEDVGCTHNTPSPPHSLHTIYTQRVHKSMAQLKLIITSQRHYSPGSLAT